MKNKLSRTEIDFIIDGIRRFLKERSFKIILFGSFASGATRKTSDIDIALQTKKPVDLSQMAYIKEYFEESDFPHTIDVVDLARVDVSFRKKALEKGKVIYETSFVGSSKR